MSKDASFDLYLNRALLFIGSTDDPLTENELFAGSREGEPVAASATRRHVMVRVRAQTALVRVEVWHRHAPVVGEVVFDGTLNLADGILAVSEFDKINGAQVRAGAPGEHRITVRVDDPGAASRVLVIRDRAAGERTLTSVRGHELPAVTIADDEEPEPATELGLILSGHDLPVARLAAAVKVLLTRDGVAKYRVRMIAEWLRWVHPAARAAECTALAERLLVARKEHSATEEEHSATEEIEKAARTDDLALRLARELLGELRVGG